MSNIVTRFISLLLLFMAVAACGGGGGGSTADVTAPVISLVGSSQTTVFLDKTYIDAGATASDNVDGNITANIVTVNPVDTSVPGDYTVTYNVSDAAGNAAAQMVRTVSVIPDIVAPVISLVGPSPVSVLFGENYIDAGATASDNADGNITADIVTVNLVNTFALGDYTVTYNVSDAAGNAAVEVVRTVKVVLPVKVSGAVKAASGTMADSDVNDPQVSYASNDTRPTAQVVGNPVTIGGYVNTVGAGPSGPSQQVGDFRDHFKVSLQAGQIIYLSIADPDAGDLDLFLVDDVGFVKASSAGVTNIESLLVPESGTFYVVVQAYYDAGTSPFNASNYVLSIGQSVQSAATPSLDILSDFVIGEAIVKDRPIISKLNSGLSRPAISIANRARLTRFTAPPAHSGKKSAAAASQWDSRPEFLRQSVSLAKWRTLVEIKALRKRADIVYAEPNYIRHAVAIPNDPYYIHQWHYPLINLPQAWDLTTGTGSIVAVIDTGVLLAHPDLQGQLLSGYDFISNPANALDGDGIDNNPDDVGDQGFGGSSFHGTHVAGTIAAASANGVGVAGVAWNAMIMPLRVLGKLGGTDYDIQQAVLFAAGLPNDSGTIPAQKADVINLSLGGAGYSQAAQDVYNQARVQGVIVVAAAGNDNNSQLFYPASYHGVVSVSAVDSNKKRAPYSNYGSVVDIAAPGGDSVDANGDGFADGVLSTHASDASGSIQMNYSFLQGTSMASPHVAGVVALMKSVNSAITPIQFDSMLGAGQLTDDIGTVGRDDLFGHGLLNAYKAVIAAQNTAPADPVLVASPASISIGSFITNRVLELSNGGSGILTVSGIIDDAAWLQVMVTLVGEDGLGLYDVIIDRSGLADGTYTANITVTANTSTLVIPIIMEVDSLAVSADAGRQYILLIDALTEELKYHVAVDAVNGQYLYNFTGVLPGKYYIISGSNNNNDGFICDSGESCGVYLTLTQPIELDVQQDMSGLDFITGYVTNIVAQLRSTSILSPPYPRPVTTDKLVNARSRN